jgi:hypothetical protein
MRIFYPGDLVKYKLDYLSKCQGYGYNLGLDDDIGIVINKLENDKKPDYKIDQYLVYSSRLGIIKWDLFNMILLNRYK